MRDIVGLNGEALNVEAQFRAVQLAGFTTLRQMLENPELDADVRLKAAVFAITLNPGR